MKCQWRESDSQRETPRRDEQVMSLASARNAPRAKRGGWILTATILGSSLAFIDGTAVNVALPALQTAMHATVSDVQWVVEAYALLLAALLIAGGSLGDLYGRGENFVIWGVVVVFVC